MKEFCIVACETLKPEFSMIMEETACTADMFWLDSGLHAKPDNLRARLQETLDALDEAYRTVLLGFGFCGNSLVGIEAKSRTLVLPIACDCFTIFLGSQTKREEMGSDAYFLTEGYYRFEQSIFKEHDYYIKRYGEARAKRIARQLIAHYRKVIIVDTGAYAVEPLMESVAPYAKDMDLAMEVKPGDLSMIRDLLSGNWQNERFLTVQPGKTITFHDSLLAGQSMV